MPNLTTPALHFHACYAIGLAGMLSFPDTRAYLLQLGSATPPTVIDAPIIVMLGMMLLKDLQTLHSGNYEYPAESNSYRPVITGLNRILQVATLLEVFAITGTIIEGSYRTSEMPHNRELWMRDSGANALGFFLSNTTELVTSVIAAMMETRSGFHRRHSGYYLSLVLAMNSVCFGCAMSKSSDLLPQNMLDMFSTATGITNLVACFLYLTSALRQARTSPATDGAHSAQAEAEAGERTPLVIPTLPGYAQPGEEPPGGLPNKPPEYDAIGSSAAAGEEDGPATPTGAAAATLSG